MTEDFDDKSSWVEEAEREMRELTEGPCPYCGDPKPEGLFIHDLCLMEYETNQHATGLN